MVGVRSGCSGRMQETHSKYLGLKEREEIRTFFFFFEKLIFCSRREIRPNNFPRIIVKESGNVSCTDFPHLWLRGDLSFVEYRSF